jgi:diketogulonate reductase-like aldo/keto reductase
MDIPDIDLSNGKKITQIGLGLWKVKDEADFSNAFNAGIEAGYRHFDSAQAYGNEHYLGAAWQKSGLKREELFITTKIAVQHFGYNKVKSSFSDSLSKLSMDYVDLLLLHFPVTVLRKKAWQALEEIYSDGQVKSIGVSNYTIRHLEDMKTYAKIMPAVNQVELHVFLQQPELIKYCHDNNIVIEAYSPLAHAHSMDNQAVASIAKKHNKSYAQVMLRWLIQHELVVIPKSVTPSRIKENIDIFDFELDKDDLALIKEQDKDMRTCWNPTRVP